MVDANASGFRGDLTADTIDGVDGTFDLLVDYGTLDDLTGERRGAMARTIHRLAAPRSRFLRWCFYATREDVRWISFSGPSALAPAIAPGEEQALFGDAFEIERLPKPERGKSCGVFSYDAQGVRTSGGQPRARTEDLLRVKETL